MAVMKVRSGVRRAAIEATIVRADGRVERLGVISYHHKNPLLRLVWRAWIAMKGAYRWPTS